MISHHDSDDEARIMMDLNMMSVSDPGGSGSGTLVPRRPSLATLDEDVALQILGELNVEDVLAVRRTSKPLTSLSHLRSVWHTGLLTHVLSRNIPIPSLPAPFPVYASLADLPAFSSEELESLTRQSQSVHENWASPAPERTFSARVKTKAVKVLVTEFLPAPASPRARRRLSLSCDNECTSTVATSGREGSSGYGNESSTRRTNTNEWLSGRYLLSFGYIADGLYALQVWDVEAALDVGSSSGSGSIGEQSFPSHSEDDDSENVKLVGEWLGSGRVTGICVCRNERRTQEEGDRVHDGGVLIALCNVYNDSQFTFERVTLRIFKFTPPGTNGNQSHSPEDSIRTMLTIPLVRPATVLALSGSRLVLQVRGVDVADEYMLVVRDWTSHGHSDKSAGEHAWEVQLKPSPHGMGKAVLHVRFLHDYILVFRENAIDMYFFPPDFPSASTGEDNLHPSFITLSPNVTHSPRRSHSRARGEPERLRLITLRHVYTYKWVWPLNSIAVSERVSWEHERAQARCPVCVGAGEVSVPVNANVDSASSSCTSGRRCRRTCACVYRPLSLAVRFDSYFPWPVNLLHHFLLVPSPLGDYFDPSVLDPHEFVVDPHHPHPITSNSSVFYVEDVAKDEAELAALKTKTPYSRPPQSTHTIPSSVRLFGRTSLSIGAYGTLVFLDSESDYVPQLQPPSSPTSPNFSNHTARGERAVRSNVAAGNGASAHDSSEYAAGTGERIASFQLPLSTASPPGALHDPQSPSSSSSPNSYLLYLTVGSSASAANSSSPNARASNSILNTISVRPSLLATRGTEGWTALAADERAGRVAVGNSEGFIEVWDYY